MTKEEPSWGLGSRVLSKEWRKGVWGPYRVLCTDWYRDPFLHCLLFRIQAFKGLEFKGVGAQGSGFRLMRFDWLAEEAIACFP